MPLYYTGNENLMVPQYGIEPSSDAYKATVIPIYYKGKMVEDGRIELPLKACKAPVLPLSLIPHLLAPGVGIEPT